MGLLKTILRARAERAAEIKAAKVRARQEVKSAAKLELKRSKLLARQEKQLLRDERKSLKAKRKHDLKMAEAELAQLKAGRFNTKNVLRYSAAARALAPIALPLIYKAVVSLREYNAGSKFKQLGISAGNSGSSSDSGPELKARISALEKSLTDYQLPSGFRKDVSARLQELRIAVNNADKFSEEKRQGAQRAVAADLDEIEKEIITKAL